MFDYSGWFAAANVPPMVVALIGVVLLVVRRRHLGPRSFFLGIGGACLVLVTSAVYLVWSLDQQHVIDELVKTDGENAAQTFVRLNLGVNTVTECFNALGIGLLLAALLIRRGPANPPAPGHPIDASPPPYLTTAAPSEPVQS
jgi:hypothetical protein